MTKLLQILAIVAITCCSLINAADDPIRCAVATSPFTAEPNAANTFTLSETYIGASAHSPVFVRLPSNPSTGYSWTIGPGMTDLSKFVACSYMRPQPAQFQVGVPGEELWQFMTGEVGQNFDITLAYQRNWEHEPKRVHTWHVEVVPRSRQRM